MKDEYKMVKFLGFRIRIGLHDEDKEKGGCVYEDEEFHCIEFFGVITNDMLIHECWHLFHRLLYKMDKLQRDALGYNTELHAYAFSSLCDLILGEATSMRKYKRIYKSFNDKKGKD